MQTVATKPTASQMMAAKRAAKKESAVKKYARENIGNKRADRNKLANIATIHAMNKMAMHKGEPQSLDAQLTENIKNLMHYEAMVYGYDRISVTVFEKLIRAMRVVACIYADSELSKTTNQAQAAIESLLAKQTSRAMPGRAAIHGNRQQHGGTGYAMDWGEDVPNMKDVIAAILITAVVMAIELSGIPKGAVQINEYQKGQEK